MQYGKNASVTANWDALQSSLSCCGGGGKNGYGLGTGYNDWKLILTTNSLPDSCCLEYSEDCGKGALSSGNIGKTHALKKYDQFALNTSCFWGSRVISRNFCYKNIE